MKPNPALAELALTWSLRFGGAVTMLAFLAVFLPVEWMASTHAALGLGELPRGVLTEYLTRSASALYGLHGGFLLALASDVRRHARVIRALGMLNLLVGALLLGIDMHAGMPLWWTLAEGPGVALFGAWLLVLLRYLPDTDR